MDSVEALDGCPNCLKRETPGRFSLKNLQRVYECPSCHKTFCTSCGKPKDRFDGCVVCPHCGSAYFDEAFHSEDFPLPEDASLIKAYGTYWS